MRIFNTVAVGMLAAAAGARDPDAEPITGPFYLTIVQNNGTEYPATAAVVSRGAVVLSPWAEYNQLFNYDPQTRRLSVQDHPEYGPSTKLGSGENIGFTWEAAEDGDMIQVATDGATFISKTGTEEGGKAVAGWNAHPVYDELPDFVFWAGADAPEGNARIRIDAEAPTGQH